MGRLCLKRGTFFSLQVYERVGISLVEVHEKVGKLVISVCKKAPQKQMHFRAVKKLKKCSCFVINSKIYLVHLQ